jgi:hypothetical protein
MILLIDYQYSKYLSIHGFRKKYQLMNKLWHSLQIEKKRLMSNCKNKDNNMKRKNKLLKNT